MAKTTTSDLDPEASYRIELTRPVKIGRAWLRPGDDLQVMGKVIQTIEKDYPGVVTVLPPVAD